MNSRYLQDISRERAATKRCRHVVQGWDLIIGDRGTIGGHMRNVKTHPFASGRFFTRILMRALDNWTSVLLASSIKKHLIGLKALITVLNCANARSYPY